MGVVKLYIFLKVFGRGIVCIDFRVKIDYKGEPIREERPFLI